MAIKPDILEAVVIGAGWAGLGVSYHLKQACLRHRVLEQGRIGETWRSQRWDSFHMNTPNCLTIMPGERFAGPDPEGFLSRDQFVALLEDYAARHDLPVSTGLAVTALTVDPHGRFHLATTEGGLSARNVVLAHGALSQPRRPAFAASLPPSLLQLDASDYRNAAALPVGP